MNNEMREQFENLFIELKKTTIMEMKKIDPSFEKGDEVDLTQEERDRALDLKILGRQSFFLKKIENGLFKIKNGTFGICEECENEIEINRLRARPTATQCINCKEEEERSEGKILYEKKSHTHGRALQGNVIPLRNEGENREPLSIGNLD